ncbi:altronate hydrolase, partial [human gut metagenome]
IMDDKAVLEFFAANCEKDTQTFVTSFLGNEDFFGQDLNKVPGLTDAVVAYLDDIKANWHEGSIMQDFLKINDNDNVVVALNTIPAGEKITVSVGDGSKTVTAREEIPAGHKMAICDIPEGGEVIKYGYLSVMPRRTSQRAAGSILIM